MIGTKARISFLQYLPAKPTKWGVKVWVLSDSHTGYIYKFKIYTGKDDVRDPDKGLSYSVVMELMSDRVGMGHHLYTDNFYSSPQLFMDLAKNGVYASGTVRSNRRAIHWFDRRDQRYIPMM